MPEFSDTRVDCTHLEALGSLLHRHGLHTCLLAVHDCYACTMMSSDEKWARRSTKDGWSVTDAEPNLARRGGASR